MVNPSRYQQVADYIDTHYPDGNLPTSYDLANALGLSEHTIQRHVATHREATGKNFQLNATVRHPANPRRAEIERALREGHTIKSIATTLQVRRASVSQIAKELGDRRLAPRRRVHKALIHHLRTFGTPPLHDDLAAQLNVNRSIIAHHMINLVKSGDVADHAFKSGASLHGRRFHNNCRILASALTAKRGIPEQHRRTVAALISTALRPSPTKMNSAHPPIHTQAIVEHLTARDGRPVTQSALSTHVNISIDKARKALKQAEAGGLIAHQKFGYLSTDVDHSYAAAVTLRSVNMADWAPDVREAVKHVIWTVTL